MTDPESATPVPTCFDCQYYEMDGNTFGHCRRYAPRPRLARVRDDDERDEEFAVFWPQVFAEDWCGEFLLAPLDDRQMRDRALQQPAPRVRRVLP